jgi:DNA-binding HxlR family transcriptional regulator
VIEYNQKKYKCPVEMAMSLISGKWKVLILWHLAEGILRFNELRRIFPDVSHKMLTQQLRELEQDGIIKRKVYAQSPPKVEYSLTEFGESLVPHLHSLNEWGAEYLQK